MSGTSLDGIDAALLETDGEDIARPGPALGVPYEPQMRALLRQALDDARTVAAGAPVPYAIRDAERRLTEAHADAVNALLKKANLAPRDVALIGFHGQTILHKHDRRWTWQLGDGALLARLTGIDVVNDFRSADVKAGGHGAPLVPLYHAALVRKATQFELPVVLVNIGGVANVTYISKDTVLAFDTGPGNAPIDDWMFRHGGRPIDDNGDFARSGKIDDAALTAMLANKFFAIRPPKSLDRLDFGTAAVEGLSPQDGAATLTAFTAASIAKAREHFPEMPNTWIGMQLLMRRPEITGFVSIAPPASMYDFAFLAPCPASGLIVHGTKDQVVPEPDVQKLVDRLTAQKGIKITYDKIEGANHFFDKHEAAVVESVEGYVHNMMSKPREGR